MSKNNFSTTINQRFEKLISELFGGNKSKFCRAIGVKPSVIGNMLGERKGNPSFDVIQKIIYTIVEISPEWLLTGKGAMFRDTNDDKASTFSDEKTTRKQQTKTPTPPPSTTLALSEREVLMQEQLAQKDKEIRALNREVGALQYENGALQKKADTLKNELEVCKKNLSELQAEALAMRTNNTMGVNLYEQPSQYPPLLNAAEPQEQYGAKIGKVRAP
jgi:hypothetical protein